MNRQQKINKLKAIMEGKVQPLQDQNLFWQQLDNGLYQCETHGYTHLILTKENMEKFQARFGGSHIVFENYSDARDEPIIEIDDNVIIWQEKKTYEQPNTTETQEQPTTNEIKPIQPTKEPEPIPKPSKKERRKKEKKQPVFIEPKAKEKAAYQRMLQEQEADREKWDRLRQLNWANQQLNNEISGLL
jgi:hypothetical protein